jgi:hypothetical protein
MSGYGNTNNMMRSSQRGMMNHIIGGGRGDFNGMKDAEAEGNISAIRMSNMMNTGGGTNMNGGGRG